MPSCLIGAYKNSFILYHRLNETAMRLDETLAHFGLSLSKREEALNAICSVLQQAIRDMYFLFCQTLVMMLA